MRVGEEGEGDAGRRGGDVGAAGTAEFVCTVNLTKTFEKAKSQRERRRSAALQTAGAETSAGFAFFKLHFFKFYFLTGAGRTNNYHNNLPPPSHGAPNK